MVFGKGSRPKLPFQGEARPMFNSGLLNAVDDGHGQLLKKSVGFTTVRKL